ncbi:hypothetical protein KJ359_006754 [Pestalotiopsis sp. 9143b]|nr:hypothetical protein KJ359_006754 [Pestalotiopsis sp. 9143b]
MPQSTDGKIAKSDQELSDANELKKSEDSTEHSKKHTAGESANDTMEATRKALIEKLDHMTHQLGQAQQEMRRDISGLTESQSMSRKKSILLSHETCALVKKTKAMVIACQHDEHLTEIGNGVASLSLIVEYGQKVWVELEEAEDRQQKALAAQREAEKKLHEVGEKWVMHVIELRSQRGELGEDSNPEMCENLAVAREVVTSSNWPNKEDLLERLA